MQINSRIMRPGGDGHRLRRRVSAAAALAGGLLLAACSSSGSSSSTDAKSSPAASLAAAGSGSCPTQATGPLTTVTYGTVPIAGTAPVYAGITAGYFKGVGLDVKIEAASALGNIVPGVVGGTYEFGFNSLGSVAAAVASNLPVTIVGQMYFHDKEQEVMVKTGSSIKTIADLKGKTIALGSLNNNYEAGVIELLEQNGLKQSDVKFTTLPTDQIATAIEDGQVDAGQINEPYIASNPGKLTTLLDGLSPFGAGAANVYAITNSTWASAHKDLVTKFIQALACSETLAAKDRSAVDTAVESYTTISPALEAKVDMPGFGIDLKPDSFNQQTKLMAQLGFLKKDVTSAEAFYNGVDIDAIAKAAVGS